MADDDIGFLIGRFGAGFLIGISGWLTKRAIRQRLDALVFWQGGMRAYIAKIAEGRGDLSDLDEVARRLRQTQDETAAAYTWLTKNHTRISKALGADVAQKIDYVTYKKMGPGAAREQLMAMVEDKKLLPESAKDVLGQIDGFNALLKEVN